MARQATMDQAGDTIVEWVFRWLGTGPWPLLPLLLQVVFGLGTFAVGAMIGSFLNVVVYRLPRGRSPAEGRSHCPACGSRILAKDNVPVLSWILLRGRCRGCDAPISSRYPLVEAGCGLLFLGLASLEVVVTDPGWSIWWTPLDADPWREAIFLYHAFAACTLLAWWLIECDGGSIPWRHAAGVLAVAVLVPMVLPAVHPVTADAGIVSPKALLRPAGDIRPTAARDWFDRGLLVSALGAAAAIILAAILEKPSGPSRAVFLGLVLTGIVFGWQGAMWAAPAAMMLCQIGKKPSP